MLILLPILLGLGGALAMGGRMSNWSEVHLRWPWFVVVALVVRVAVAGTSLGDIDWLRYVYVASLVALIGWTLWNIDRLFGIWIVSLGSATNLAVICANDFRMPIAAAANSRLAQVGHHGQYVFMDQSTRLNWLADWIAAPWLGGIFSPGDVLIGLGLGVVAFAITRRQVPATKLDVPQRTTESEGR